MPTALKTKNALEKEKERRIPLDAEAQFERNDSRVLHVSRSARQEYETDEGITLELEEKDQNQDIVADYGYSGGKSVGEHRERPQWGNRFEFLMVLMGYAIGIANVWRFPYLCAKFGGGSFLFAYIFSLIVCAFPLFFYEMVLGQYFQKGPVDCFKNLYYRFRGIAYISAAMMFIMLAYYQVAISWAIMYFVYSFHGDGGLPWAEKDRMNSDRFFYESVLNRSPRNDQGQFLEDNSVVPGIILSLFLVWFLTYICLFKGIHSAGKIAIFMVIFPFLLMFVLLCRCAFLEGAGAGISYYLTPVWSQLLKPDLWVTACGQILFSLSPGTGAAISLSSFNPRMHKGLFRDAVTIGFFNSFFSIMGGFVVFSVIGHMSFLSGKPIQDVTRDGPGLAFVLFAEAFTYIEGGRVFSALFFLMLVLLGLDSSFAMLQTLQTHFLDALLARRPDLNGPKGIPAKWTIGTLTLLSVVLFCCGIAFTTRQGSYYLETVDHFCPTYCLLITAFLEYITLGWIIKKDELWRMIYFIHGPTDKSKANENDRPWLRAFINFQVKFAGPLMLFLLFIATILSEGRYSSSLRANPDGYETFLGFPTALIVVGWLTVIIPVSFFIYYIFKSDIKRFMFVTVRPKFHAMMGRKDDDANKSLKYGAGYPHLEPQLMGNPQSSESERLTELQDVSVRQSAVEIKDITLATDINLGKHDSGKQEGSNMMNESSTSTLMNENAEQEEKSSGSPRPRRKSGK